MIFLLNLDESYYKKSLEYAYNCFPLRLFAQTSKYRKNDKKTLPAKNMANVGIRSQQLHVLALESKA